MSTSFNFRGMSINKNKVFKCSAGGEVCSVEAKAFKSIEDFKEQLRCAADVGFLLDPADWQWNEMGKCFWSLGFLTNRC